MIILLLEIFKIAEYERREEEREQVQEEEREKEEEETLCPVSNMM